MIPYGKDNWRRNADTGRGEWFAARGYAFVRVDVRGTGSSAGVAMDEYTEVETRDGYDAVEWLAAQPWCTGAVGMWGISYGAFTAIQVAKLRPPHLLAIVPVQGTDDRYLTDVHYIGGCVTASELSQYGVSQVAMNAMPPDVGLRGDGWLDEWRARLELTPPWLITWLRNQADGPYWRPGSLAPEYDAIEAAILNIGGWCDAYVDSAFRMQARCTAPSRTLVGNWVHGWPQDSIPGPNLDELHEVARFFDRWLKGERNGLDDEPAVVWFERDYSDPEPFPVAWPGRWRATSAFPHPAVAAATWWFDAGGLPAGRTPGRRRRRRSRPGSTCSCTGRPSGHGPRCRGAPAACPTASRATSGPTRPSARPTRATRSADRSRSWASRRSSSTSPCRRRSRPSVVRLTDVAPDGTSSQVSAGILNLTHRRSDEQPEPMEPGHVEEIRVPLRHVGYRFEPGHRVRVSVASSAWPVVWPSPSPASFELHRGPATPSRLVLPEIPAAGGPGDLPVPAFKTTPPDVRAVGGEGAWDRPVWRIEDDVIAGTVTVTIHDGGEDVLEDGRRLYAAETLRLTASDKDPASARLEADVVYRWHEIAHEIEIRARSLQTSDAEAFDLSVDLEVDLDGERLFERAWRERIPRHLV